MPSLPHHPAPLTPPPPPTLPRAHGFPTTIQVITTSGKEGLHRRQSTNDIDGEVRGLTTASAIWITAGLGMACGAGLFFTATLGATLTVSILKISRVQQSIQMKVGVCLIGGGGGRPTYGYFAPSLVTARSFLGVYF